MAVIEQLVFGYHPDRDTGREVLGQSPGVSRDCAQEAVRFCEGWGAVPAEGLRRPALMCFPLATGLSALPGDLHVVIRITQGLKPIYHALVISHNDFLEFDLNPFALAQEDVFLSSWTAGEDLPRREIQPGSLAPVVSPPPGVSDVGFADEAVRQMLANERLLLPLERGSNDSDRFLALVVAGLPRALRQGLRFASWAPSGTNSYSLAATYREDALFTAWQPFLMTSVLGKLSETCEEYLDQLKVCLRTGDLAGLERHSRNARVDLGRQAISTVRSKPKSLTAAVDEKTVRKIESTKSMRRPETARRPSAVVQPLSSVRKHTIAKTPSRPRSRPRRRARNNVRNGFALTLSAAILMAGAYYLWTSGQWTRLPGVAQGNVRLQTDTSHGVVDIAAIYQGALKGAQQGSASGTVVFDDSQRRRGLEVLHQAGELLDVQSRGFLDEVDQTLAGEDHAGVKPAPAERLYERGEVLARELRRLALARMSLRSRIDWRDLAELDGRALEARFDSLLAQRPTQSALEPELMEVDRLLRSVDVRARQVGGLARLEDLLARENWDPQWCRRCETAIDDLGGVRQERARLLRDDARAFVRLKRAEHATGFATRAYGDQYTPETRLTSAVAGLVPPLQRRTNSRSDAPALLKATVAFYRDLDRAAAADATVAERSAAIEGLAGNHAVAFDAAVYAEHVSRLRFLLLEQLWARGADPDSLPQVCFAGGDPQDYLDVLQARHDRLDAAGWRQLSTNVSEPFLVRWASHRADRLAAAQRQKHQTFLAELAALRKRRETLLQTAASDGRCGPLWQDLTVETVAMHDRYRGVFPDSAAGAGAWARLADFRRALALTPALALGGVTVRLDQSLADEPQNVVVVLQVGQGDPLRTEVLRLGPAAPVGTGWVGSTTVDWAVDLVAGTSLSVRVLAADAGQELARFETTGWLADWDPRDLRGLDSGTGVRVSWRLAQPYWQGFVLPEIDDRPES